MLRGALQKHEQENAAVMSSQPPQNHFASNPPSQTSASHTVNPGFRNPLKPATASAINGLRNPQDQRRMQAGVKRTASGLAKAMDGSFEDGPGSKHQPININQSPAKNGTVQVTQNDFIGEDDFDSDVELDVEEPIVKYPSLPASNSTSKIVYPTLPRQQQAQTSYKIGVDEVYGDVNSASAKNRPPGSSAPLPWSSSPAEHLTPAVKPYSVEKFRYGGLSNGGVRDADKSYAAGTVTQQASDALSKQQPSQTQQKPSKRRTLPWMTEDADAGTTRPYKVSNSYGARSIPSNTFATPASKEPKKSQYPWNTTASAVKEQQRQHREANRKHIKKIDGDDDSFPAAKSKSKKEDLAPIFLSDEQKHVLALVDEHKKSVFFTGSAGTGKSVLMRQIIEDMKKKYVREPDRVAVTASTGLAACNIGGVTLHSFAGFGLGKEEVPELVRKIKKNQKAKHRWLRTKVLIVDEISMVDGDMFDKLEAIARNIRNNGRPFGGIQLVVTGDFFQLPPVPDSGKVAKFAFDAATWKTCIEHTIALHHVFRQKDPVFAGMLNEMREGRLQQSSINAFRKLCRPLGEYHDTEATELFPTRQEVDQANNTRLGNLLGRTYVFEARDGGAITDVPQRDKLLQNCMAAQTIVLKKGCQVMLVKNVDETLVNGSIGRVMGFMDEAKFDSYIQRDREEADLNEDGTFSSQTEAGKFHDGVPLADSMAAKKKISVTSALETSSRHWPVVRFIVADGTTRDFLCMPELYKIELPNGEVQASRQQIPLILAWALSIHKAQGQTLARVKVDLGKVFEKGQAYVALSRATSMAGLQVLRFDPKKVIAHDRVRTFYSNLSRVELSEKNKRRMSGLVEDAKKKGSGMNAEDYEKSFVDDAWEDDI